MFLKIKEVCEQLIKKFDLIPGDRKKILKQLSKYIQEKKNANFSINLVYICTHNSRRSHFGQVWASVAADYYSIENVHTFSGGTEATAFNPNAIHALKMSGFDVKSDDSSTNPIYLVKYGGEKYTTCCSKLFDEVPNPSSDFAAIMTCSQAEENCPFVSGADLRIAITYEDPKEFDGTIQQEEMYNERSNQIAMECLYVFSLVNH